MLPSLLIEMDGREFGGKRKFPSAKLTNGITTKAEKTTAKKHTANEINFQVIQCTRLIATCKCLLALLEEQNGSLRRTPASNWNYHNILGHSRVLVTWCRICSPC